VAKGRGGDWLKAGQQRPGKTAAEQSTLGNLLGCQRMENRSKIGEKLENRSREWHAAGSTRHKEARRRKWSGQAL